MRLTTLTRPVPHRSHLVHARPVLRVGRDVLDDRAAQVQQLLLDFRGRHYVLRTACHSAVQHGVGAQQYKQALLGDHGLYRAEDGDVEQRGKDHEVDVLIRQGKEGPGGKCGEGWLVWEKDLEGDSEELSQV